MKPEERQRHLQVLPWILERLLERDTRHTESMVEAIRVAFAALEREGEMEAERAFFIKLASDLVEGLGQAQRNMLTALATKMVEIRQKEASNG